MACLLRLTAQPLHAVQYILLLAREGVAKLLRPFKIVVQL